jgi:PAS domain S-box-containing protein
MPSMKHTSPLLRYGVAVLAVGMAFLVKLLLDPLIVQETPFLLVFGAIMISAWYGGLGPGLLATFAAGLATDYFFLPPTGSLSGFSLETVPLLAFFLEGTLVCLLTEALRAARVRAEGSKLEAERHREHLRESEELYRNVVEQAAENIFLIDPYHGQILQANASLHHSLGYEAEELHRLTLYDIVAHDQESIDRNVQRVLDEGRHLIGERRYRRKDGSLIDVEVSAGAIAYGGRPALCVVAHDVTQRKMAEEALRRSLDALLALYETGQILSSSLEREEIGSRLLGVVRRVSNLAAAVISIPDEKGELSIWRSSGLDGLWRQARLAPEALSARREVLESREHRFLRLRRPEDPRGRHLVSLYLPLLVRDRIVGVLEAYGPKPSAKTGGRP